MRLDLLFERYFYLLLINLILPALITVDTSIFHIEFRSSLLEANL